MVELMVAIDQPDRRDHHLPVFETSEGVRRTATSGGDAQQNGAVALYFMEATCAMPAWRQRHHLCGLQHDRLDSSRTTPNFPPLGIHDPGAAFITAGRTP